MSRARPGAATCGAVARGTGCGTALARTAANRIRRGTAVRVLLLALTVAASSAPPVHAQVEVRPSLEPRHLAVGDTAVFTLRVRAGLATRVRIPAELELENFLVVGGPSQQESLHWGTGGSGRTYVVRWVLQARKTGTARVGALTIEIGGEPVEVPGASARVVESAEGRSVLPPPRGPGRRPPRGSPWQVDPRIELRAEVDSHRPWAGEQIAYTLWVYAQTPFGNAGLAAPPSFPGFWAEEVDLGDPRFLAERVYADGEWWQRLPLLRRVLFPLRPGRLEIEPLELTLDAGLPPPGRFDFLRPRTRRLSLRSNPVIVEARPLPAPPPDFSGAVGRLALDAALEPASIALGDGATLTVELSGRGNLQGVTPPPPTVPPGLDLLPPEEDGGRRIAGVEMAGRRTWRYPLAPDAAGRYPLPPLTLTYFDPKAGEYRRTATPELVLTVAEPPPTSPSEAATADAPPPVARPARPLPRWLPAAALAATVLAVGLAWWAFRNRRRGSAALRRWRRDLERARAADRPRRAAALLEESWRDLLAGRWRLPRELPPASWEQALRAAGAEPATAAAVGALTHDLHALRQAPELSAVGALTDDLIARSLRLARILGR